MTTGLARFSLAGRGALVTGGTKGIGLAIVRELTELGAQVVTCARTVDSAATAALPPGVHVIQADVASRSDRERLLEKATSLLAEEGGGGGGGGGIGGGGGGSGSVQLSILVNNAGTNIRKPTVAYTGEEFASVMATNFESAFHLSQLAHPILKAASAGVGAGTGTGAAGKSGKSGSSIVMVSSVSGGPSTTNTGTVYAGEERGKRSGQGDGWACCSQCSRDCVYNYYGTSTATVLLCYYMC